MFLKSNRLRFVGLRSFRGVCGVFAALLLWTSGGGPMDALCWAKTTSPDALQVNLTTRPQAKDIRVVSGQVLIDAPPSFVWQTLTQYQTMADFVPGYKQSQLISSSGLNKIVKLALSVSPIVPTFHYNVKVDENRAKYRVSVKRIEGDFNFLQASYQLVPRNQGNQTLLLHTLEIDPGLRMMGVNGVLQNHTKTTLLALQKRAEEKHRKSLIGQTP